MMMPLTYAPCIDPDVVRHVLRREDEEPLQKDGHAHHEVKAHEAQGEAADVAAVAEGNVIIDEKVGQYATLGADDDRGTGGAQLPVHGQELEYERLDRDGDGARGQGLQ
jgi:hypothetical protein